MESKHQTSRTSTINAVELQDLGGGHWRAVCGGRSFCTDERGGDLWVDHRELAQFFGYVGKQGPTNLKSLLANCIRDGLVLPEDTVMESITNQNGDLIEHISLKRCAALALAMRCTLPNAVGLARQMITVFERWLDRRKAPPSQYYVPPVGNGVYGLIGSQGGKEILAWLRRIADAWTGGAKHSSREWKRARGKLDARLRRAVQWGWTRKWDLLPKATWDIVLLNLDDMHQEACRDHKRLGAPESKQLKIPLN